MNYILVENGKIVGNPTQLPKNWANVSNFYLLDNQTLKQYGWYPYRFQVAQIGENQVYDGSDFVVEQNEVVEYQKVRNKTAQEIQDDVINMWTSIRNSRNRLLFECDWTQLADSPLTNQKQTEWQIYRQSLRDITNQPNPFSISWPTPPEA
jgi:inorganic pyrophosphatase/exopolyphosphatase